MKFFLCLVMVVLLASSARADMGYNPPVNVHLQFENLDEFPQYDFYLKYGIGQGNPYVGLRLMKVPSSAMFKLEGEGRRLTEVILMAVPRGHAVVPPPKSDSTDWLRSAQSHGIQTSQLQWKDGMLDNYENPTAVYRVNIQDEKISATWIAGEIPMQQWEKARLVIWSGLALSALIVAFGLFFNVRWLLRRSAKASGMSRTDETHEK